MNRESLDKPNYGTPFCSLVLVGLLEYYFAVYAFSPPSSYTCYAGPDQIQVTKVLSDLTPTNVTANFHTYFLWMFIALTTSIVVNLLQAVAVAMQNKAIFVLCNNFACLSGCLQFAMLITGTVFRFRNEGKACSGDFEMELRATDPTGILTAQQASIWNVSEGQFIKVWTIIQYSFIGLLCCCITTAVAVAIFKR